jgi:hypothetical protein
MSVHDAEDGAFAEVVGLHQLSGWYTVPVVGHQLP